MVEIPIIRKQLITKVVQLKVLEAPTCLKKKVLKETQVVGWTQLLISKEIFFPGEKVLKVLIRNQIEKSFSQQKSTKKLRTA